MEIPVLKQVTNNSAQSPKKSHLVDYNVDDLHSEDETDDEEEPNKPIPKWANFELVQKQVFEQRKNRINFTKLFKSAANDEIDLCQIFTIQRNRFNVRTSSAHWETPPVWQTNGIDGNDSFRDQ